MQFRRLAHKMRVSLLTAILMSIGSVSLACTESEDKPVVGVATVEVGDDFFSPRAVRIAVNTELTWTW